MGAPRGPLIVGNWKMNGRSASLAQAKAIAADLCQSTVPVDVVICPPATLIASMAAELAGTTIAIGAQDCHAEPDGAFTGDVSAPMCVDAGATFVILGHSERRSLHGESDEQVGAKVEAAIAAGLVPIICVGETLAVREAKGAVKFVQGQIRRSLPISLRLESFAIAYEPVWAIGTGLTPSREQISEMHSAIRMLLTSRFGARGRHARILYGGSVKPDNAESILNIPDVNGSLVGGASLDADKFCQIIRASCRYTSVAAMPWGRVGSL